jgi:hypothetical protein
MASWRAAAAAALPNQGADDEPRVAVIIPCYNEALTIRNVVTAFRAELPDAAVYVFDNGSSDATAEEARRAGALVGTESRRGKGYVVQSMFQQVDADVYVMTDGDETYPPAAVHRLLQPVLAGEADMVVGSRLHERSRSRFRALNSVGNLAFRWMLNAIFHVQLTDILSGYRAFSRAFVKNVPLSSGGFEVEAELTIKALQNGYRVRELPVDLAARPEGSRSKVRIVRDGFIILNTILALSRDYKPLTFFGAAGSVLGLAGVALAVAGGSSFLGTGLPADAARLLVGLTLGLAGFLLVLAGLIVHTVVRRFQELNYRLRMVSDELRQVRGEAPAAEREWPSRRGLRSASDAVPRRPPGPPR